MTADQLSTVTERHHIFSGRADTIEQFARQAITKSLHAHGVAVTGLRALDSITNFVYRGALAGQPVVVKFSLLGLSKATLMRRAAAVTDHRAWLDETQRAYLAAGESVIDREAAVIRLLSRTIGPRFPRILSHADGVLVSVFEDGPESLAGLVARGDPAWPGRFDEIAPVLREIWRIPPESLDARSRSSLTAMAPGGLVSTFARKFASAGTGNYLSSLGLADAVTAEVPGLAVRLLRVADFGRAPAVVFGDLKPDHIFFSPDRGVVLIDPAVHLADPAVDLARLLARLSLLTGRQVGEKRRLVHRAAAAAVDLLPASTRGTDVLAPLMVMDVLNILSTRTAMDMHHVTVAGWPDFSGAGEQFAALVTALTARHRLPWDVHDGCSLLVEIGTAGQVGSRQ